MISGISTTRAHDSYEDTRELFFYPNCLRKNHPTYLMQLSFEENRCLAQDKKRKILCWHESF